MTSLSDQVDRLSRNTKAIRSIAVQTASTENLRISSFGVPGPFTCAVLNSDLGDLIRDIDPSELGLFTLLTPQSHTGDNNAHDTQPIEISRADFPGSTPLRKAPLRRDDAVESKEIEPEVYAQAALKYINRYEPIRFMPRAHSQTMAVLEKLTAVRRSIRSLSSILEQVGLSPPQPEEEEKRVQELHLHLQELKRRKISATSQHKPPQKMAVVRAESNIRTSLPSPHEDKFWSTPAAAARTLRFSDNLMDGNLDLNDITTTSFIIPASATPQKDLDYVSSNYSPQRNMTSPSSPDGFSSISTVPATSDNDSSALGDEIQESFLVSFDADLSKPASLLPPPVSVHELELSTTAKALPETSRLKHSKVRITNEVERILEKIWITAGDLIMPGHSFEIGGHNVEKMTPPKAKGMVTHLQLLSESPFILESPTASSVSSLSTNPDIPPTSQQILTAYLLLTLLTSAPRYSMPLNQIKDLLASKAMGGPISAQGITRVVYGCVAKRLIKIERGGGEQIVKFDI